MSFAVSAVLLDLNDVANSETRSGSENSDDVQHARARLGGSCCTHAGACVVRRECDCDTWTATIEGIVRIKRISRSDAPGGGTSSQLSQAKAQRPIARGFDRETHDRACLHRFREALKGGVAVDLLA